MGWNDYEQAEMESYGATTDQTADAADLDAETSAAAEGQGLIEPESDIPPSPNPPAKLTFSDKTNSVTAKANTFDYGGKNLTGYSKQSLVTNIKNAFFPADQQIIDPLRKVTGRFWSIAPGGLGVVYPSKPSTSNFILANKEDAGLQGFSARMVTSVYTEVNFDPDGITDYSGESWIKITYSDMSAEKIKLSENEFEFLVKSIFLPCEARKMISAVVADPDFDENNTFIKEENIVGITDVGTIGAFGITNGHVFSDLTYILKRPVLKSVLENMNVHIKSVYAFISSSYGPAGNIINYENMIASPTVPESTLPNIQVFTQESINQQFLSVDLGSLVGDIKVDVHQDKAAAGVPNPELNKLLTLHPPPQGYDSPGHKNFGKTRITGYPKRPAAAVIKNAATVSEYYQSGPPTYQKSPAASYESAYIDGHHTEIANKFRNVIFDRDTRQDAILEESVLIKDRFPMYNYIEFSTDPKSDIGMAVNGFKFTPASPALVLEDIGVRCDQTLISKVIEENMIGALPVYGPGALPPEKLEIAMFDQDKAEFESSPEPASVGLSIKTATVNCWDLRSFVNNMLSYTQEQCIDPNIKNYSVFVSKPGAQPDLEGSDNMLKQIIFLTLEAAIKDQASKKFREFYSMFHGTPAYCETIFYRIEKSVVRKSTPGGVAISPASWAPGYDSIATPEVVQNFYITNVSNKDVLKFVDTQVKYAAAYIYKIFAYKVIIGTQYYYQVPLTAEGKLEPVSGGAYEPSTNTWSYFIKAKFKPFVKMIEVPYYEFGEMMVMDKPPMSPNVNFYPYRGINNKLLLALNASTGAQVLQPTIVKMDDAAQVEKLKISQRSTDTLHFSSDDVVEKFEIFRSTTKPIDYIDFSKKLITTLNARKQTTFVDDILPNTKYYYTFRSLDIHGNYSNPTTIYEVEMRDDGGASYLIINNYDIEEREVSLEEPRMKKYLSISVPDIQLLDLEAATATAMATLGLDSPPSNDPDPEAVAAYNNAISQFSSAATAPESTFGKKFKIRLTSKQTGKKIDININYILKDKVKTATVDGGWSGTNAETGQ